MTTNPPAPQATPLFKGFAIREYTNPSGVAVDANALWNIRYTLTSCSTTYENNYIYRFAVKVEYPQGMVDSSTFPPSIFAILYSGTHPRDDDTMILPLVAPGFGSAGVSPIPSQIYNQQMATTFRTNHMIEMQQQNPNPDLKNFYYGFLQLDYHYPEITYEVGTHTIELMIGTGKAKAQPDQWSEPLYCQWDITL